MKLFHASSVIIKHPDVVHSRRKLDFGQGFYLTSIYEQARKYTARFLIRGGKAYINEYLLDSDLTRFNVKRFETYDEEWLDFVSSNRKGEQNHSFDMVEGGIANDKVFNTIDLYFSGLINKQEALGRLSFEHPNHQICILSQEIINQHLHFVSAEEILKEDSHHAG